MESSGDGSERRFVLKEVAPGVSVDDVLAATRAKIHVPASVGAIAV